MYSGAFFIGATVGALTLPALSDVYGRKKFFVSTLVVTLLLMFAELAIQISPDKRYNLWILSLYFALNGIVSAGRRATGYCYFVELVPRKNVELLATIWIVTESPMINIYYTLILMYLNRDWKLTCWVIVFLCVASFTGIVCFIPESPKWLYSKERYAALQDVLLTLAKRNGVVVEEFFDIVSLKEFQ